MKKLAKEAMTLPAEPCPRGVLMENCLPQAAPPVQPGKPPRCFNLVYGAPPAHPLPMASLFTPAHLHLALNHVPIIGLAVACLPILIGILFQSRGALASGLLAVVLCVGTMPAIMETGEGAQESFVDGSIEPGMDAAGKAAFREHSGRAKFTAPVVYAAGLLAVIALLTLIKFPREAGLIGWTVLLGCILSIALSIWTAEAGGRIRHPEFRPAPMVTPSPEPPPATPTAPAPSPSPSPTTGSTNGGATISTI